jgi:hypothetical protein
MDAGTVFVMIVGLIGLAAVVLLRTRGGRTALRARADLMDRQLGPAAAVGDDVREQALLLLDRGEKIAAIKLLHEQADLGLREARDYVAHLENTTTFVRDDDPPMLNSGWDERPASARWDDQPPVVHDDALPAAHAGWDERPAAVERSGWDDSPRPSWDDSPSGGSSGGADWGGASSAGSDWSDSSSSSDSGSSNSSSSAE